MTENILLGAAALLFLLSLLDVLLSGDQKKWLEDRLLRLWNWLDEVKRVQVRSVARAMATARAFKASLAWIFGCLIVLDVVGDVVSIPVSLVAWGDAMLAKEVVLFVVAACVVLVPFALIGDLAWLALRRHECGIRGRVLRAPGSRADQGTVSFCKYSRRGNGVGLQVPRQAGLDDIGPCLGYSTISSVDETILKHGRNQIA
jgi:hypothetical protein